MADNLDPAMRSRETAGATRGGMDPEGLMPADPELHAEASEAGPATSDQSVADALTSPHDQPVEGGVEEAEDDPLHLR
ncbi:MAG TPA: hypothetical protein VFY23_03965 [Candidatus Limnocylindrales bacterium]|nr:hypothetical protein [Candidatus Limnocylindrales bacterium]